MYERLLPVVIGGIHISGHAKVSYLHHQPSANQTVPGGQVSVDEVLGRYVHHSFSHLDVI